MAHRLRSLVVVGMLGVAAFGCGSDSYGGSPTTPSALVSLEGSVIKSELPSEVPNHLLIEGATVTILDGANEGRTATTNDIGRYEFEGLTQANANFSVTHPGYLEARAGGFINGETQPDWAKFALQPAPAR